MKVSIVIPSFNHWDLTHQLLWSIYKKCGKLHEVILVDDASTDKNILGGLEWWLNSSMNIPKVLVNENNLGFLLSSNRGLKEATGDVVILISTDVLLYVNILPIIEEILLGNPKSLISGTVYRESTGWNKFGKKIFPYAEGYLLSTTKASWEELGYLDERYAPNDFEDVDLSTAALSKGYELKELPADSVLHKSAQSIPYGEEREKLTKINQEKFRKKWIK